MIHNMRLHNEPFELIKNGTINDAKTICAIYRAEAEL